MMIRNKLLVTFAAMFVLGMTNKVGGGEKSVSSEQGRFFETNIRPLLVDQCQKCHGPKKQQAGLRLDSRENILQGGESGAAAVPGQPEKSLMILAIRHAHKTLKMPEGKKLSDREIADLTRWVQMELPFPESVAVKGSDKSDAKAWWSFQPVVAPPVPNVRDAAWPQSPLDHFILVKLEAKGLKPAARADRVTLIRRATYDLIGLPPTPDEIDAFVKDRNPSAFAKVVDRLLASPHYGERWGRHWLDVARYSDSNGLDENVAFGNAWRYRDYVVKAFNDDLPFDQFVHEQIAGDLLSSDDLAVRHRRLIATGFLSLGPKVLAEVDEKKMEMDIVDEQIDTVGRAFLGLTLGCARCHDHKFDPFPMTDYYGLAGIFKSTKTMEHFKKVARWHEVSLASEKDVSHKAALDKQIAKQKADIQTIVRKATDELKAKSPGIVLPKNAEAMFPGETQAELKRQREELAKNEKTAPVLPSAMAVADGAVVDVPIHVRGNPQKLGKVVSRRLPQILVRKEAPTFVAERSGRLELANWLTQPEHPLTGRVMVNRIWRWHFGHGIVRTVDNFGTLGELPDNQPLLDWLTHRFTLPSPSGRGAGGEGKRSWSIKAMHRVIMLSSTYQMSSTPDPKTADADPENRLHGRANVRRLEAEAIRDAMLAVSGSLDKSMGGSLLHVKNRDYLFDHTSRDLTSYESPRRSIYLPVVRNNVYDVFQLFDFPDPAVPNGDRATTTVAPQALFLLNSDWAMKTCDQMAESLLKDANLDDAGRVRRLYRKAYGREASAVELAKAIALVDNVERALHAKEASLERRRSMAWSSLCQVVVAANEFVYVR